MHYKNGRPVKLGDRVISAANGTAKSGIVIALGSGDACNIAIVPCPDYVSTSYQSKEFLHVDDVAAAEIPNTNKGLE